MSPNDELYNNVYNEFVRRGSIRESFKVLSVLFNVSEDEIKRVVSRLCKEGKIVPDPNTNTRVPEDEDIN